MLLSLDPWVYSKLNAIPSIANVVVYYYPNSFSTVPVVAYHTEQSTSEMDFQDDAAKYVDARVTLDVYTANGTDDTSICQDIDAVMSGLLFTLEISTPVPERDVKLQHRRLEYSRAGIDLSDLV